MKHLALALTTALVALGSFAIASVTNPVPGPVIWPNCAVEWGHNCSVLEKEDCKKCVRKWCTGQDLTNGLAECNNN